VQQAGDAVKAVAVVRAGFELKQFVGHLQHALALDAGAQQQCQQFDVTQGAGAACQQFFAGSGIGRKVLEWHGAVF